jgi:hypothetical protein
MTEAAVAAKKQAYDAGVNELARSLATYRKLIPTLYPGINMPAITDEAAYQKMARDLLEKKKTTIGTTTISIDPNDPDNLDARDSKNGGQFKKALGVTDLNQLVSSKGLDAFSSAIGDAVEKNSSDIGFLRGASIQNVLAGLFQWIMGGFAGGFDGLKKQIAEVTAENIHADVTANLTRLRGEKPELASMLSDERIRQAADGSYYAAMDKAGFAVPEAPQQPTFNDIVPVTIDSEVIRRKVYAATLNPASGVDLETRIREQYTKGVDEFKSSRGWYNPKKYLAPKADEIAAAARNTAPVIADSISRVVTDQKTAAKLADMTPEKYADFVAAQVRGDLEKRESTLGFAFKFSDKKPGSDQTYLDDFTNTVRQGILANHSELASASRMAATNAPSQMPTGALSAAKGARDAGMGNAMPAEEILAQAGPKVSGQRTVV